MSDPYFRYRFYQVRDAIKATTPAGMRILKHIYRIHKRTGAPISRADLAAALGRPDPRLSKHDRDMLQRLVDARLIVCQRRALPTLPPDHHGRGARFYYWIDDETERILTQLRRR